MVVRVGGPDDARIADYRDMRDADLVRLRGVFVAEGRRVVERLIEDGRYVIRSLLLNQAAHLALEPVLARLPRDVPVYLCGPDNCSAIAGFNMHRGCVAMVERPQPTTWAALVDSARRLVILEGATDPDNVGGVFRNAAAFAADAVLLSPTTCDPLYRKAVRTSMAATLKVPFARAEPWPDVLTTIGSDVTIVALTPREPAITLDEFVAGGVPARVALLLGGEGFGLTRAAESRAHCHVLIPISGSVDSLNLAVASGIALSRLGHTVPFEETASPRLPR